MARKMLIDSTHPEETRVVVVNGNRLEEFDYETETKAQLKGNIYLAKVTRVEPSLQAAFVEYGGNRHGFLAFNEIHPDYYQIPVADREEESYDSSDDDDDTDSSNNDDAKSVEEIGGDEGGDDAVEEVAKKRRTRPHKQYKIQEVIKRRQIILIQVAKEERGNKGAALTSYLSLAGRYCVLMPNTSRGGGVSRKISNGNDRKRLKSVLSELGTPKGMSVIVRTAGAERSKVEIRRDFDYIFKLWDDIRSKTLAAIAPSLIHEEANLIKRSMRDLYSKDMEEIQVAGEKGYRIAKDFMKALIPSHAKKVQRYKSENGIPLFQRYQVESQLMAIHDSSVRLRSGGSIVLNQTEALVAIDVNSGKATRERHIDDTAYKTNLEAAEEVARQLRLRDLAGLIVIDFIDMDDNKNEQAIERKLKEALRRDRARIQVGRISPFGLLEMSRQRLRPSLMEAISQQCATCGGTGFIQSIESAALSVLRAIEEEGLRKRTNIITVTVPADVALYILNHKRAMLSNIEDNYNFTILLQTDNKMLPPNFELIRTTGNVTVNNKAETNTNIKTVETASTTVENEDKNNSNDDNGDNDNRGNKRNRRRRRSRKRGGNDDGNDNGNDNGNNNDTHNNKINKNDNTQNINDNNDNDNKVNNQNREKSDFDNDEDQLKRRKRGRRGGRRKRSIRNDMSVNNDQENIEKTDGIKANDNGENGENGENKKPNNDIIEKSNKEEIIIAERDTTSDNKKINDDIIMSEDNVKTDAKKTLAKKSRVKKASVKKARAKKATAKKIVAKKATAKKSTVRKAVAKKAVAKASVKKIAKVKEEEIKTELKKNNAADNTTISKTVSATIKDEVKKPEKPKRKGWWNRVLG